MNHSKLVCACLVTCFLFCCCGIASADYETAVLALNPSNYWKLNETEVGTAVDSVGSIDGTHAGFYEDGEGEVGAPGPDVNISPGNVAFLANDIASIDLGDGGALAASTMTYAGWFRENGSQGGDRLWTNNQNDGNTSFQIFFGGGSGDVAANIGIGLNPSVNGFPTEGLPSGSGVGNFHIPESTVAVKDDVWHHIVASRNGNNIEDVIVVIDGVNYGPDTWRDSTDTWGTTGSNAHIATRTPGDGGGSRHALNGSTDEVAIWLDRQLTVEESISLYESAFATSGLPGDADSDGDVDGDDLIAVQSNFGSVAPPPGDADFDGDVDGDDLIAVQSNFGDVAAVGALSVPEPSSLALLALSCCGALAYRRRS